MPDVCFVLMPYAAFEHPSIAMGILKATLNRVNITSKVIYANLLFAERIGINTYYNIGYNRHGLLLGEWTFAESAFPEFKPNNEEFFQLFDESSSLTPQVCQKIREIANDFIIELAEKVVALNPKIVSCSSTFDQHCPSLALLRKVKELNPEIITLIGGANCEGEMGMTTHENFPWVDFVASGEGDETFPALCSLLLKKGLNLQKEEIPYGIIGPQSLQRPLHPPRAIVHQLDNIPTPDYDDYFDLLKTSSIASNITPGLLVETSRGCWWGQRSHCTFCGLNGDGMNYRSKSPEKVIREFQDLEQRYQINKFEVVDNIIAREYFQSVLPYFAQHKKDYTLFYETKSNLKRAEVKQLASSGVYWIQPGIESLHDECLKLMRKGVTAAINLQLLKWCLEEGIHIFWNFLFDFPGEQDSWYEELAEWIPLIRHLQPPSGMIKINYHRFSPYYQEAESFGLDLSPSLSYRYVYPVSPEAIANLAYVFEATDSQPTSYLVPNLPEYLGRQKLNYQICMWVKSFWSPKPHLLCWQQLGEKLQIFDSRPCATEKVFYLQGLESSIYRACDRALTPKELIHTLKQDYQLEVTWEEVEPIINKLKAQKILLGISGRLFSLATGGLLPKLRSSREFPGGHCSVNPN